MRSSWETGAIFTGLHVGPNVVTHGDIDCGNFYLEMGGVLWFGDPGSENYNIGNYFSNSYRKAFGIPPQKQLQDRQKNSR